jgi:thiol-disulfide isomerase/thioredoxin
MALNSGYDMSSFTVARLPRGRNKPDALPVKGKVTVVELWATWCKPCTELIPHLSCLQSEFSEDLEIVGFTGQEEDKGFEYVQNFCRSKGDKLQYAVLSLNNGSELPEDFRDFETYPHAIIYDKNGRLIYKGSPSATQFEEILRRSLCPVFTRRAVFLQALNLPKMDDLSQSDPFCAIFVKPVNIENGNWAMCGFGPYFPGQSIPPHKAHLTSQKSKAKEGGQVIGKKYDPKQDPHTLRNQMMTTEVIRDRNDAVWSNYFIVDSANYPGEWEVLFAVYDHVRVLIPLASSF